MKDFQKYKRTNVAEMIKLSDYNLFTLSELLAETTVSVSIPDKELAPDVFKLGYIARDPNNHNDMWYVSKKYFDENFELNEETITADSIVSNKTLDNTSIADVKLKVSDVVVWGDGDTFKLISKASSKSQGWMKSCKAMEIEHVGCIIQVTTQQDKNVAEALVFVPDVRIDTQLLEDGSVISRKIVKDSVFHNLKGNAK
jgi:hypothetical protein